MKMCIKVWFSIWPAEVMISDRLDWISLKFIVAHDQQQNTGRVQKGRLHASLEDRSILI